MKVEGKLVAPQKGKRVWGVEIDSLGIFTQGKSEKDALKMAKEAIELLAEDAGLQFIAVIEKSKDGFFSVGSNSHEFVAFILKRMRQSQNLTIMDIAARLSSKSPNSYARYEQGKSCPSIEKLEELLKALNPSVDLVIKVA